MTTWYTSEDFAEGTKLPVVQAPEVVNETRSNRKLKRLPVDHPSYASLRRSLLFESTTPVTSKTDYSQFCEKKGTLMRLSRLYDGKSRYPKMENMPHFHYDDVELGTNIQASLYESQETDKKYLEDDQTSLLVYVECRAKSWILRRTLENFSALDKQIHRCLFDRKFSRLKPLHETLNGDNQNRQSMEVRDMLQAYLLRLSEIADNVMNCGPVLNWFEIDNRGNHLLLTDESAINVPGIAAAHVIKRYHAQAADEISLEVGDIISIIDMPPVDESIWWRGKRGFEVGFFPSQCVEVIGDYSNKLPLPTSAGMHVPMKPVAKKRGKLISFLRLFLSSRPSRARLMQSGILKERTFGSDLGEHLAVTCRQIPLVLEKCAAVIEEHGIVDGIYRLSGSSSIIQKLRFLFDGDEPPELDDEYYLRDVHCISSLLKMYFRELPNPLLTYSLYDKFVSAIQITDEKERKVAIHHVVQQLPPPHYRTLEYLLQHLAEVASHAGQTAMHAKNLAIVWAPNLLKPRSQEYGSTALLEINVQAIIVEYLIRNAAELFDRDAASIAIVSNPQYNTLQERGPHHRINSEPDLTAAGGLGPRLASISVSPGPKLISLEEARSRTASAPNRPPRPDPPKTLDLKPKTSGEPYQAHPSRASPATTPTCGSGSPGTGTSSSSISSGTGKSFKAFFSRSKSFNTASFSNSQESNSGFYYVSQDIDQLPSPSPVDKSAGSPVSYAGESHSFEESLRHAHSAEDLAATPPASDIITVPRHASSMRIKSIMEGGAPVRPPRRSKAEILSISSSLVHTPRDTMDIKRSSGSVGSQLGRNSSTSGSFRERTPSGGALIRRHPVLTSFSKMTSEQTVYVSKVEYVKPSAVPRDSGHSSQRRASTGTQRDIDRQTRRNSETKPTEQRPLSVYDNRPASVYDNEPTIKAPEAPLYRYSSPVFTTNYRPDAIPEDARQSCPEGTPPLPRAYKRRPQDKFSVTGARLAQSHAV
ncbi:rho GTPase-activating protein 32 isoform X2 [Nematostella vectensis]|uniref:rho GTPase-activating protein 32 isoform X2 n=1 Tax=Nematostella vectensis TaxID=45351 RepID=UPI0020772DEB|nr:rho GTPase-activating protein 32 isoform X2 [Nematostella vectensis]